MATTRAITHYQLHNQLKKTYTGLCQRLTEEIMNASHFGLPSNSNPLIKKIYIACDAIIQKNKLSLSGQLKNIFQTKISEIELYALAQYYEAIDTEIEAALTNITDLKSVSACALRLQSIYAKYKLANTPHGELVSDLTARLYETLRHTISTIANEHCRIHIREFRNSISTQANILTKQLITSPSGQQYDYIQQELVALRAQERALCSDPNLTHPTIQVALNENIKQQTTLQEKLGGEERLTVYKYNPSEAAFFMALYGDETDSYLEELVPNIKIERTEIPEANFVGPILSRFCILNTQAHGIESTQKIFDDFRKKLDALYPSPKLGQVNIYFMPPQKTIPDDKTSLHQTACSMTHK